MKITEEQRLNFLRKHPGLPTFVFSLGMCGWAGPTIGGKYTLYSEQREATDAHILRIRHERKRSKK